MRKTAIASGAVGIVLLVAAGLLAWWITPSYIARLPGNANHLSTSTGTMRELADPAALASGNLARAIRTGLPATLTERVKVLQTSGNTALVQDTRTISVSGSLIASLTSDYAVNRQTLEATTSYPSNWHVTRATGLPVDSWPLGAKQQNYTLWIPLTYSTATLNYVKQAQQGGINTYEYQASVPPALIKNPQALAGLPKSLPIALLTRIRAAGIISSSDVAALSAAFPHATSIPLGYTYQAANTYWVAPTSGLVINVSNNETEVGGILLPGGRFIPILPVLADTYHATSPTVSAAVTDNNNASSAITTWGVTVPIVAAAVGFVLVVLAVILWSRKRSRGHPTAMEGVQPR